jgi:hypothetical protein
MNRNERHVSTKNNPLAGLPVARSMA